MFAFTTGSLNHPKTSRFKIGMKHLFGRMNWKGSAAVVKGAETVAINVGHLSVVLSVTNVNRSAGPTVIFKLPSGGSLARKGLEKDSEGNVARHVKSAVTHSGHTTMGIMQEVTYFYLIVFSFPLKVHSHIMQGIPPPRGHW